MEKEIVNQVAALRFELDRLWRYLGYSEEQIALYRRQKAHDEQAQIFRREIAEIFKNNFESASRYTNVVVAIGFALSLIHI